MNTQNKFRASMYTWILQPLALVAFLLLTTSCQCVAQDWGFAPGPVVDAVDWGFAPQPLQTVPLFTTGNPASVCSNGVCQRPAGQAEPAPSINYSTTQFAEPIVGGIVEQWSYPMVTSYPIVQTEPVAPIVCEYQSVQIQFEPIICTDSRCQTWQCQGNGGQRCSMRR